MIIYPAIDIMDGKCVRLQQGKFDQLKIYSNDPSEIAKKWEAEGARFLHVVDLNGAAAGRPVNLEAIEKLVRSVHIPVQIGGGIRNILSIEQMFDLGVKRVVLGTTVITSPELVAEACLNFGAQNIVAAVDVYQGKVSVSGWREKTSYKAIEIAQELSLLGLKKLIYTDIASDGMLGGVNLKAVQNLIKSVDISVIVSGGVSTIDDIRKLKRFEEMGVEGIIVGKALYEGTITLKEAIEAGK